MCGIVGYVGHRNVLPVLLKGLEHLAYRGYDSAGVVCLDENSGNFRIIKEKGKLACLKKSVKGLNFNSHLGIGHTRWATHGEPSRANAHPHTDSRGRIALVHNGIIENYGALKSRLLKKQCRFLSETDTEVAARLIGAYSRGRDLEKAFLKAVRQLDGFFAFVVMARDEPDRLIAFRRSNPLCIGLGQGENFIASDVTPLLSYTDRVIYLEDDDYAIVTRESVRVFSLNSGRSVVRKPAVIRWSLEQAQKSGYPHFMLKEIYEQPRVLEETLSKRIGKKGTIFFDTLKPPAMSRLKTIQRIFTVSCGTAFHAGLVGARMIEECARIPVVSQVSSEFRYADPIVRKDDMVLLITQSGETADTLAALREAKKKGALTVALVNVVGSTVARESDAVIYTHAGPEIGVASTKAYTAQLMTLALFALYLAAVRKSLAPYRIRALIEEALGLPRAAAVVLKNIQAVERAARRHFRTKGFLYLGRGYNFPTALEGALKLKEISYAHAHGYAAGEMKHGPIALIDSNQPVICIAPPSRTYDKMISNIEEIRARGGIVISVGAHDARDLKERSAEFFGIPKTPEIFSPLLTILPLQLFAYKIAVLNRRDVDQPRNLAKSVTVE